MGWGYSMATVYIEFPSESVCYFLSRAIYELSYPKHLRPIGTITDYFCTVLKHKNMDRWCLEVPDSPVYIHPECNYSIMYPVFSTQERYDIFVGKVQQLKGTMYNAQYFFPEDLMINAISDSTILQDWISI